MTGSMTMAAGRNAGNRADVRGGAAFLGGRGIPRGAAPAGNAPGSESRALGSAGHVFGVAGHAVRRAGAKGHGRIVAALAALALAVGGFAALTAEPAQSRPGPMQVSSRIVRPGDTLWSYAADVTPAGGDVSETVDRLIELNGLDSGSLRVGQRIIVPVE